MIRHTETPWHVRVRVRMLRLATWGGRYVHGGVCASACVCVLVGMALGNGDTRAAAGRPACHLRNRRCHTRWPNPRWCAPSISWVGSITHDPSRSARRTQTNKHAEQIQTAKQPHRVDAAGTRRGQTAALCKAAQHASDGSATGTTLRTQFQPSSGATDTERHAARRTAGGCTQSARPTGEMTGSSCTSARTWRRPALNWTASAECRSAQCKDGRSQRRRSTGQMNRR
jgi:hypothetical protein